MTERHEGLSFEDRVDRSAVDLDDLKMLLRDITRQVCASDQKPILGADAIDAVARSIERIEDDLWAIKNDMEVERNADRKVALAVAAE